MHRFGKAVKDTGAEAEDEHGRVTKNERNFAKRLASLSLSPRE